MTQKEPLRTTSGQTQESLAALLDRLDAEHSPAGSELLDIEYADELYRSYPVLSKVLRKAIAWLEAWDSESFVLGQQAREAFRAAAQGESSAGHEVTEGTE